MLAVQSWPIYSPVRIISDVQTTSTELGRDTKVVYAPISEINGEQGQIPMTRKMVEAGCSREAPVRTSRMLLAQHQLQPLTNRAPCLSLHCALCHRITE